MIHSYSCKNFYSFKDSTTLNFTVKGKTPKDNSYFKTSSGVILSKVETVIGANASGKTNLLKVLPFLKWLIIDSFSTKPSEPILVKPFQFSIYKNKPIELSVEFEISGDIYIYSFVLNSVRILLEELKIKNKTNLRTTNKTIFLRKWDSKSQTYSFESKNFNPSKGFKNLLRSNTSVIGVAMRLNHKLSKEIAKFWQEVNTNVAEAGWVGGDAVLKGSNSPLVHSFDFFSENETLKKEAEKILSRFDLGLTGFDIVKERTEEKLVLKAKGRHLINGKDQYLNILYESAGTMQLFVLLPFILQVLEYGGVAVLDEFDTNLHPEVIISLFELFVEPKTNPNNAQLLFSTQNHLVLTRLEKAQIVLVEKNKQGVSESWRLDDVLNVRADDNYYSKYLSGTYGATPKID